MCCSNVPLPAPPLSALYLSHPLSLLTQRSWGRDPPRQPLHAYIHTCMHHTCMHHACMHTHTYIHTHTCMHACMHACVHAYMHAVRRSSASACSCGRSVRWRPSGWCPMLLRWRGASTWRCMWRRHGTFMHACMHACMHAYMHTCGDACGAGKEPSASAQHQHNSISTASA